MRWLRHRARLQRKLSQELKSITKDMVSTVTQQALPILQSDEPDKASKLKTVLEYIHSNFDLKFTTRGKKIYNDILQTIIVSTDKVYIEAGFAIPHHSTYTQDLVGGLLDEYLSLIKTIPQDVIQASRVSLINAIGGFDRASVVEQLQRIATVSERRIELIARDQTAKANEAYNRARAVEANFTHYTWKTAQDTRVSTGDGGHKQLNYRIYSYETPTAIIDSYGTKGHPAQRPNCRCHSDALYLRKNQKLKLVKDSKHGDYFEIITS